MKRVWKSSISVLLTVLMVCSMITVTLPMSVGAEATSTSKWSAGSGASVLSESSVTWVTDIVEVDMKSGSGYVQLDQILTDLIGENGEDGQGYINIICDNYMTDYSFVQLVGDPSATGIDPIRDTKAMTWYLRTDGSANSLVYLRGEGNPVKIYGIQSQIKSEGFMFAFSKNEVGNVMIRGIGERTYNTFDSYEDTTSLISRLKLSEIQGAGETSGEDGVYFRLQSFGDATSNLKYTIKVVYPKPKTSTVDERKPSRWTTGGGAEILSESHEAMVYDTVRVNLAAEPGFVQHHVKLTDLIGSDGKDGKGYIHIIPDDPTNDYSFVQLVGDPSTSGTINPSYTNKQAMTWYVRSNENLVYSTISIRDINSHVTYGNYADYAEEGYVFAFSKNETGNVMIRGIGDKTGSAFDSYAETATALTSRQKLSEIQGVGEETDEDGVYFRIQSFGGAARNQTHTIHIVYPDSEDTSIIPETSTGPENLIYKHVFANQANMKNYFAGACAGTFYLDDEGDYVYSVPTTHTDSYTKVALPDGSYTVKMNIKSDGSKYMGVLLGYGSAPNDLKWMNIRFDPNYDAKTVSFYVWEHCGTNVATPTYGTSWYKGDFDADTWHEVVFKVTPTKTMIYFDGYQAPDFTDPKTGGSITTASLGHFPTSGELNYIGFFPSGATQSIKNFGIYEGVDNIVSEKVFEHYDTAKYWFKNVQQLNAHDQTDCYTVDENGDYIMRVPVISNGGSWISGTRTIPFESYKVSVDFSPNRCITTSGVDKVGGAGFLVGEKVSSGYRFHQLRFDFDMAAGTMSFRGHAQGSDPEHTYSSGIAYIDSFVVVKSGLDFSTKQWFNLTAEVTGKSIQVFLDGEQLFVEKIDRLPTAADIAYFGFMAEGGTAGFDVKNFSITEGVEGEIKTAAPELDEAITLHLQADVDVDDAESVQMKFTFKGEVIWVDGVEADGQYTFSLPDILPQDMCENISAELYIDGMRKDKVATYSLQQYCMNMLPSAEDAAADTSGQKQKLRDVLIAMLNYGTESQKYFEGVTDATLFANSQLDAGEKTSVNQAMTNAGSVRSVGTRSDANNYWKSASLALFNTVRLRFKFVTNDASKITIKVGETTYDNFELSTGNIYYWDYDGVYAHQFDTPVVVGLYVDGVLVQEVTYSINSYVNAFVAANDETSKSYALIQAVYDYGCAASAYNP